MLKIGVDETLDIELVADGANSSSRTTAVRPRLIRTRPPFLSRKSVKVVWVSRVRSAGPRIHNHIQTTPFIPLYLSHV
jgi:hypothetical protein